MTKKTKIILKETKYKIGNKGDILNVSSGYAFNYLIPRNIAELAKPGKLKHLKMLETMKNTKFETSKKEANIMILNLQNINKINIKKKNGENQQIFGRVNEKEILSKIFSCTGYKLDKKQITIPDIKQIGIYKIDINLLDKISTYLKLNIIPEIIKTQQ